MRQSKPSRARRIAAELPSTRAGRERVPDHDDECDDGDSGEPRLGTGAVVMVAAVSIAVTLACLVALVVLVFLDDEEPVPAHTTAASAAPDFSSRSAFSSAAASRT